MGQWLATVRFPDGTCKYAMYSTVTESMFSGLYPRVCPEGGTLPDGAECHRAEVAGDPDQEFPDAGPAPVDELLTVVISAEPDGDTWHALFCPRRKMVLGPLSSGHARHLQYRFQLVPDDGGVRHLRPLAAGPSPGQPLTAACGRPVSGEPVPFNAPWRSDGGIGYQDGPRADLYADWERGDMCRECLVSQLPEEDEAAPAGTPSPPPPGLTARILSWAGSLLGGGRV